jgi:hypothetical protein
VAAVKLGAAERRRRSRGHDIVVAAAVQMLAALLGAYVRTGSPTAGSRVVFDFSYFVPKLAQVVKSKWMSYLAPKIPNFCMQLAGNIVTTCSTVLTSNSKQKQC